MICRPRCVSPSGVGHRASLVWLIPIVAVVIGGWLAVKLSARAARPSASASQRRRPGGGQDEDQIPRRRCRRGARHRRQRRSHPRGGHRRAQTRGGDVDGGRHAFLGGARACRRRRGIGPRTLLSGAYIGVDVGTSKRAARALHGPGAGARRSGGKAGCSSRPPRARSARARRSTSVTWRSGRSPPRSSRRTGARSRSACSCARRSIALSRPAPGSGSERDSPLTGCDRRQGRGRVAGDVPPRRNLLRARARPGPGRRRRPGAGGAPLPSCCRTAAMR